MAAVEQLTDDATQRSPAAPTVVARGLPDMPERTIASPGEDLETPIGIPSRDVASQDEPTAGTPAPPAVISGGLQDVPEGAVCPAGEDLETSIGVTWCTEPSVDLTAHAGPGRQPGRDHAALVDLRPVGLHGDAGDHAGRVA